MRKRRIFLNGQTILIAASLSILSTVVIVYLTGLNSHRTIIENSFISLSILALVFLLFLSIGLYIGLHINDNLSHKFKIMWGKPKTTILSNSSTIPETPGLPDVGDGIEGILLSIVLWVVMTVLFILFLILLELFLWAGLLGFVALIYWVIIRALKLIFAKSSECQGDLFKSVTYGAGYTVLYIGWVYGVIYLSMIL
ncbi:hypothetical protein [Reichenbachiella sp.]|uniref:hypothetical protein n=1 Tax=Reichenbachiella sp. TaxID=2184521 RepID=UPI003BAFEDC3